jgi:hypothetical protein
MASVLRAFGVTLAIVLAILLLIFELRGCQTTRIEFLDLRVVNDTSHTVQIQPCWDLDCIDTHGLPSSVLRPGSSTQESGFWPNDVGGEAVVAVQRPGARPWQFHGCLIVVTAPGQKTGVVRVSQRRPCLQGGG